MKKQLLTISAYFLIVSACCAASRCLLNESTQSAQPPQAKVVTQSIESTFGMIKPDAVANMHSGVIIKLTEQNGFTIDNMQKRTLSKKEAETFYAEHKGKPFFNDLVTYITSGPVIGMQLKKENAITDWRTLIGSTDPAQATVGTLRKMFATSKSNNAVHGSDSAASAQRELRLFFNQ